MFEKLVAFGVPASTGSRLLKSLAALDEAELVVGHVARSTAKHETCWFTLLGTAGAGARACSC